MEGGDLGETDLAGFLLKLGSAKMVLEVQRSRLGGKIQGSLTSLLRMRLLFTCKKVADVRGRDWALPAEFCSCPSTQNSLGAPPWFDTYEIYPIL